MHITPSMQQYLDLKKMYPDCILLFQMGDFYETFFEDAKTVAKELNIILTSREKNNQVPMAGFPIKALDTYLPKLIKKGYKVAIAEQIEDPKNAKGLVKRKVVEVVTNATLINNNLTTKNNFIASLYTNNKNIATLAFMDILGSTIYITHLPISQLLVDFIKSHNIKDFILTKKTAKLIQPIAKEIQQYPTTILPDIPIQKAKEILLNHFNTPNMLSIGLENTNSDAISIAILLDYIQYLKGTSAKNITRIQYVDYKNRMYLDSMTLKNLEIFSNPNGYSLFNVINKTNTAMGYRMLYSNLQSPLLTHKEIQTRLDLIQLFLQDSTLLQQIRETLPKIADLERIAGFIGLTRIKPKQTKSLQVSLQESLNIFETIKQNPEIHKLFQKAYPLKSTNTIQEVINLIQYYITENPANSPTEGPVINAANFSDIQELRNISTNSQHILDTLVNKLRQELQIDKLKIGYNKIYGFYFEIPKSQEKKLPPNFIKKQTLVNSVRFITPKLQELETTIQNAQTQLIELENKIYQEFLSKLTQFIPTIQHVAELIGYLDFITNGAYIAQLYNYSKPKISKNKLTAIKKGRHPVIEQLVEDYVSNDLHLDTNKTFALITGPNMGGKSTYIRQTALIQLLMQIGYFVPAQQANLSIKDRIFARVGASDNLAENMSTFMVEMSEVAVILNNATENSLIILDEIGRGTSTLEGIALAYAISEHLLTNVKAHTLFATHYYELTELEKKYSNFVNLKVEVYEDQDNVIFLHKVSPGTAQKSYGIHIAKMVNLPSTIIENAQKILQELSQYQLVNTPKHSSYKTVTKSTPKQQPLIALEYDANVKRVVKRLKQININKITPLKALDILNELQNLVIQ